MARIPEADDLGYRTGTAVSQGVAMPQMRVNREAYVPRDARQGMRDLEERIANEELAKAEVQWQVASMQETQKADADGDIDQVEETYAAAMQDQMGKAAAGITDSRTRQMFMIRGEESLAKANYNMNQKTTAKKNDREKGYMVNAIDAMVKGGKDLQYGDPAEAGLGIQMALDSMVERNVISNVEAQGMMRQATYDIAYGRLKAMSPEQQLEVINSDDPKIKQWIAEVPPEAVRQLKEQAEEQGEDLEAHNWAMSVRKVDEGAALDDMYQTAAKEGWSSDKIDKHRLRIMRIKQDDEVIRQKKLDDYYEEGAASIHSGETTIEQILSTDRGREMFYEQFTEAERNNLRQAQDNAVKRQAGMGRKYSDRPTVEKMKAFIANGQVIEGRKYWAANYAKLSDQHFDYFNSAFSPTKSSAPDFKPVQTTMQVMSDYLDKYPLDDEKEAALWQELNGMAKQYYIDNNGANPTRDMVQGWVEDKHANVVITPPDEGFWGWAVNWGGEEHLARDLPPVEKAKYESVINVYRKAGIGAKVGNTHFNGWTEQERNDFRQLRRDLPDMPADLFLATWQTDLEMKRAEAKANPPAPEQKPEYDSRGRLVDKYGVSP